MYLVTGGAGFLGAALVHRLVRDGARVRVLDDLSRGSAHRLEDVADRIEFIQADVRDADVVARAAEGVTGICHLAFVNGTERFYRRPDLVLDVGVRGIVSVLEACRRHRVHDLLLVSSSEVYHEASRVPTDESAPLIIPDPCNPRFSYAAGKIISEMLVLHASPEGASRTLIVRPHNVYGPDMGWEHVIPQLVVRMRAQLAAGAPDPVPLPIQGTGEESRAYVHVDDLMDGVSLVMARGQDRTVYHLGTTEEVTVRALAEAIGGCLGRRVSVIPGPAAAGSPRRRCPDIRQAAALGYHPRITLREGLPGVVQWYDQHAARQPQSVQA